MARRGRYTGPGPVVGALPDIFIPTATVEAFGQHADMFRRLSGRIESTLDENARVEETLRGRAEGLSGQVDGTTLFAPTIRGRAYTASALSAFEQRAEASISMGVEDLASQYWNDPDTFAQEADDFIEQWITQVPEALRPAIALRGQVLRQHGIAVTSAARTQIAQEEAEAASIETHRRRLTDIGRLAGGLFSTDGQTAESAVVGIMQILTSIEDAYGQTYTDPTTGAEIPLFSPRQRQAALAAAQAAIRFDGVQDWFEAQPDRAAAYAQFQSGALRRTFTVPDPETGEDVTIVFDPLDGDNEFALSADELERLDRWMEGEAATALIDNIRLWPGRFTIPDTGGATAATRGTIGFRGNNWTNLRPSSSGPPWIGQAGVWEPGSTGQFLQFETPEHGIRAATLNARTWIERGRNTIASLINTLAPAADHNDPTAYVNHIERLTGMPPDTVLDPNDQQQMTALMTAMVTVEIGSVPDAAAVARGVSQALGGDAPAAAHVGAAPPAVPAQALLSLPGFQALSPHSQAQVITAAQQVADRRQAEAMADLRSRLDSELAMLRDGVEVPLDSQVSYDELFAAAGTDAEAMWRDLQGERQTGAWLRALGGLPADQQEAIVADAAATPGPQYAEQRERQERLELALNRLREENQEALARQLTDEMTALQRGDTVPNPTTREQMQQAFGVEEGNAQYEVLEGWRDAGIAVRTFPFQTPEERAAAVAGFAPEGENYATEAAISDYAAQALRHDREQRADGAAYVLRHNDIVSGQVDRALEAQDPVQIASAVNAVMEAQQRIGIADPRPMPAAMATNFLRQWRDMEDPAQRVDFLHNFIQGLGGDDTLQAVMRQLADSEGAPDALLVIASMDLSRQRGAAQELASIAYMPTSDLKALLPPDERASDIDDDVLREMVPFIQSVSLNGAAGDTISLWSAEAQRLAYWYARNDRHSDPGGAAVDDLIAARYAFFPSGDTQVRVPVEHDADIVEAGIGRLLRNAHPFVELGVATSVEGATVMQGQLWSAIQDDGFWATMPDDSGLQLMLPTALGAEVVIDTAGNPVVVPWSRAIELGRREQGGGG